MRGAFGVPEAMDVDAVDEHGAGVDAVETGKAVEHRRLAVARGTHHHDELTCGDVDVDASKGFDIMGRGPVRLAHPTGRQDRLAHS